MTWLLGIVATPWFKYVALGVAVIALVAGGIAYHAHVQNVARQDGRNEVINDVQSTTIKATDDARKTKEQADEKVRTTPYNEKVEGTR